MCIVRRCDGLLLDLSDSPFPPWMLDVAPQLVSPYSNGETVARHHPTPGIGVGRKSSVFATANLRTGEVRAPK